MRRRIFSTRTLQVGILILLIVSATQVLWWMMDQFRRTEGLRQRLTELYTEDVTAGIELQRLGVDQVTLEKLFPQLTVNSEGEVVVRPESLESLEEDRARWLNQYGWEGAFFLIVLVASMTAVWRALHQESLLRRRQQNFIAAVSHELKSPLASLQLSAETLNLRELSRERVLELAVRMTADLERMKDMIRNILDTSRLEQPKVELRSEAVPLALAVTYVVEELDNRAQRAGTKIEVDIGPELEIRVDPVAVQTVLRNLLDNSLKAVETRGGGKIRIGANRDPQWTHLSVSDDGVGFFAEDSERLFEKFYRPGDEMLRAGSGQGLGLYIVKRLVELQDGRVTAHSEGAGRGAEFVVSWPNSRGEAI
ncbi:MAG: HAMP domain-containing sensor histidine kinase [Thermoanaerobaculia bacterium]